MSKPPRVLYWNERMKITGFDLKYKAVGYVEEFHKNNLIKTSECVYILGRKYQIKLDNIKISNFQIYNTFNRTIWITYRYGFPELVGENNQTYVTDAGWGCMLRVGQMQMAQLLKKHLNLHEKQDLQPIIQGFNDFDSNCTFSIQNIAKVALKEYKLYPGKWYDPCRISYVLSQLFYANRPNNCQNLEIVICNSSTLFFDEIIFKMAKTTKLCQCKLVNTIFCSQCYNTKLDIGAVVMVMTKIGIDYPEKKYLNFIQKLMEIKYFQGMIGGKPEKALYFLGKHQQRYIYMDPHLAQQAHEPKNLKNVYNTYFCESFRQCKNTSIDPSLGISFYLRNMLQLQDFYQQIKQLKQKNPDECLLYISVETPDFADNEELKIVEYSQEIK